jgi:cytochrome c553
MPIQSRRPYGLFRRVALPVLASMSLLFAAAPAQAQSTQGRADAIPAFKKLDSIEARVQGCVTCHGQQGQGTADGYFPRIAGKPAGYLYNQLTAFRDGTRSYPPMNYLVAYLPDPYLKEIAEYFSAQRPAFHVQQAAPADAAAVQRGKALATLGDPAKGIPACIACHGANLTGMVPGIPGLAGLRPAYVVGQLTRWKVGERRAAAPDCMKRIASRLSDIDITSVAAWLSEQTPPANASPEPSNLVRMPLACGSQR